MTVLSTFQIAQYAYNAGWRQPHLAEAIAVVMGESSGRTDAVHTNPDGSVDRGLWQINTIHADVSDSVAFDPLLSTAYAFRLYSTQGWRPWSAYGGEAYTKALPDAQLRAQQVTELVYWPPLQGWSRMWDKGLGQWTYRQPNGPSQLEIVAPVVYR